MENRLEYVFLVYIIVRSSYVNMLLLCICPLVCVDWCEVTCELWSYIGYICLLEIYHKLS